jgi:hypothetical protein
LSLHVHLQEFLDRSNSDLMGLTDLVQGELTEAERLTLGALITVDVHACDVVRELQEAGIKQMSDFEWVSRLRYYWRDDVFVDMAQVRSAWTYRDMHSAVVTRETVAGDVLWQIGPPYHVAAIWHAGLGCLRL